MESLANMRGNVIMMQILPYRCIMARHVQLTNGDSISHLPGEKLVTTNKGIYLGEYKLMFSSAIERASAEAYEAMPTLGVLMGAVKFENLARLRSSLIAARLDVSQATVDRHLVKLRKIGLIEPDEAEGDRQRSIFNWRICPYLAWKGNTEALSLYMQTLPKDHVWHSYKEARA